jgi:hypothetical protein
MLCLLVLRFLNVILNTLTNFYLLLFLVGWRLECGGDLWRDRRERVIYQASSFVGIALTDSIRDSFIHATDFPSFYDGLGHIQVHATIAVKDILNFDS